MDLNAFSSLSLAMTLLSYALLIGAFRGSVKQLKGHYIMLPLVFWASTVTYAQNFDTPRTDVLLIAGAWKVYFFSFFMYQLQSKNRFLLWLPLFLTISSTIVAMSPSGIWPHTYQLFSFLLLGLVLLSLLQLEMCYRECEESQSKLKTLLIGLFVILISDFVWYSDALVKGVFSWNNLHLIVMVLIACLPLLLVGLLGIQRHEIKFSPSRQALFQGGVLILCGVYLLFIGVGSSLLNIIGVENQGDSQLIAIAVLLSPLSLIFASTQLRRHLRVKISKHLFAEQFDYRASWMKFSDLIHKHRGKSPELIGPSLIRFLEHEKGAYVTWRDGRFSEKFSVGLDLDKEFIDIMREMLSTFESDKWIIDRLEILENKEHYSNDVVTFAKKSPVRWYIPVLDDNTAVGFLLLSEQSSESNLWINNWELRDYLSVIAQQTHWFFVDCENAQSLSNQAQLSAFTQTSAFVLHDLKNIEAQVGAVLYNAAKHQSNPAFIDSVFKTIRTIQSRLQKTIGQLGQKKLDATKATATMTKSDTKELLDIWMSMHDFQMVSELVWPLEPLRFLADPEQLSDTCNHLLRNAIDACSKRNSPRIRVVCSSDGDDVKIAIQDNGIGMSPEFIAERLFKPLQSTKGNAGMGLGCFSALQFAKNHGGALHVESLEGEGTTFEILLPLLKD